uniref:Uncharacterized protein n=1 Tax=Panagrolaimus superbus TaxID=310955 RepID=A0A914YCP0_9BILA
MNNDVEEIENNKSSEEQKVENNKIEVSEKDEKQEEKKEKSNETHDIKIEPKSRADRFFSKTDTSVFPTPRFDLLKPEDLKKIPEDINKAVEKEAKKISKIYDDFNKRIDTASLIKRIEESEKRRLEELKPLLPLVTLPPPPPPLPKVTLAPSHDEAEKKAMHELEKLFEDLGKNFQQIVQG